MFIKYISNVLDLFSRWLKVEITSPRLMRISEGKWKGWMHLFKREESNQKKII